MSRFTTMAACALAASLVATTAAQNPPQSPPQERPKAAEQYTEQARTVTLEGCLVREQDVPGRKPNIAEKQGILEDFILTETKFVKGAAPGATGTSEKPEAVGTTGMRPMYEVRGLDDEKLKQFAGKRVQIEGRLDAKDAAERSRTQAKEGATSAEDLPELHGTVIRAASGDCPPKR